MLIRILLLISLIASTSLLAQESSKLGLDYLALTENQLLTDIMLRIEPKLIDYYEKQNFNDVIKRIWLKGMATAFSKDTLYPSAFEQIKKASPELLLEFLKLPKDSYPELWAAGRNEQVKQDLAESLKLYKALHGKEYIKTQP